MADLQVSFRTPSLEVNLCIDNVTNSENCKCAGNILKMRTREFRQIPRQKQTLEDGEKMRRRRKELGRERFVKKIGGGERERGV